MRLCHRLARAVNMPASVEDKAQQRAEKVEKLERRT
jgi:hypothetical protein